MTSRPLILLALALAVHASGCSRHATITRHDGWQIDAEITRSTQAYIYAQPSNAPEVKIARRDIADVDHPGNVMGVIGLSFMAAYTLNIGLGAYLLTSSTDPYNREIGAIQLLAGSTGMLIGAGFAYWGWSLWDGSITATGSDTWPSVHLSPTVLSDDQVGAGLGAGLHFEF